MSTSEDVANASSKKKLSIASSKGYAVSRETDIAATLSLNLHKVSNERLVV